MWKFGHEVAAINVLLLYIVHNVIIDVPASACNIEASVNAVEMTGSDMQ